MGSCYANFGLRKYFGGVPKFPLCDVIENTRDAWANARANAGTFLKVFDGNTLP